MVYKGKVKGNKQERKSGKREMMVGKKKGNIKGKKQKGERKREEKKRGTGISLWENSFSIFEVWCNKYAWLKLSNKIRFTLLKLFKESWIQSKTK